MKRTVAGFIATGMLTLGGVAASAGIGSAGGPPSGPEPTGAPGAPAAPQPFMQNRHLPTETPCQPSERGTHRADPGDPIRGLQVCFQDSSSPTGFRWQNSGS